MKLDRDIPPDPEEGCEDCGAPVRPGQRVCRRCMADSKMDERNED